MCSIATVLSFVLQITYHLICPNSNTEYILITCLHVKQKQYYTRLQQMYKISISSKIHYYFRKTFWVNRQHLYISLNRKNKYFCVMIDVQSYLPACLWNLVLTESSEVFLNFEEVYWVPQG